MRRRSTLFFSLVVFAGFLWGSQRGLAASPGSILLKAVAVNPSETETQKVPIELPLPREVGKKDIIDLTEGLEIRFDTEKGVHVAVGEIKLKPGEQKTIQIHIEDIWQIPESEIAFQQGYTKKLSESLSQGPYAENAKEIERTVQARLEKVLTGQKEPYAPSKHIAIYRENLSLFEEIKRDIRFLEKISTDKTPSAEEALEVEGENQREGSPADSIKTITLKIMVKNPSETEKAILPVDYYLPREIKEKDILNPGELEPRVDLTRGAINLHKDEILLEAGGFQVFEVVVRDIWRIDPEKIKELQVKAAGMAQGFEGTKFEPATDQMKTDVIKRADAIINSQTTAVGRPVTEHIAAFVENLSLLKEMKETVMKMAQIEALKTASPQTTPKDLALEDAEAKETEAPPKEEKPGLKVPKIFKDHPLDKRTLWKVIYAIVGFLGLISLLSYLLWWNQARVDKGLVKIDA